MTAGGIVATSAPIFAACRTWTGWRTLATRISVSIGVIVVDLPDVGDQRHAVEADVVVTPDERRDERRPRLCREQRLRRREAQRDVDHHAVVAERLADR